MSSLVHGKNISEVEISNISSHGIWLYAHGSEYFLSYEDFPWFLEKSISSVINVEETTPGHFYWPDLDIDLTTEIISSPERFPLKSSN